MRLKSMSGRVLLGRCVLAIAAFLGPVALATGTASADSVAYLVNVTVRPG